MNKTEFLTDMAKTSGTDKLSHGYIPYYGEYLPNLCRSFLEIGVAEGKSAEMWNHFYGDEELDLHLIDLFLNPDFVSPRWCRNRGFVPHMGSQSDMAFLSSIKDQFEVIVDDGSHNAHDQFFSFKHLFINNLRSGGIYVIEDVHCNTDSFYWGGLVERFEDSPLAMFEGYKRSGIIDHLSLSTGEESVFNSLISRVEVCDRKIIFIWKK